MPSPAPYEDDDRTPRGFGRLYGDVSGLAGAPTGTLRRRKPSKARMRIIHRKLIIAACHDRGIAPKIVAEFLGVTDVHVRRIYREKGRVEADRRR